MKIRAVGPLAHAATVLGCSPVSIPMGELYPALERGVIEGALINSQMFADLGLGEVLAYALEEDQFSSVFAFAVVMNKEKWNALPEDTQQIIREINKTWTIRHSIYWDEENRRGKEAFIADGGTVLRFPQERSLLGEVMAPIRDAYVQDLKDMDLPGDEALELIREITEQDAM